MQIVNKKYFIKPENQLNEYKHIFDMIDNDPIFSNILDLNQLNLNNGIFINNIGKLPADYLKNELIKKKTSRYDRRKEYYSKPQNKTSIIAEKNTRSKGEIQNYDENIHAEENKEINYNVDKKNINVNEIKNIENNNKEEEIYKKIIKDEEFKLEEKRFNLSVENALNFYEKEELIEFFKLINKDV